MNLKLVAHAKDYIDSLARGYNPLTGEEVAEDDVVNQVRISRCLFFVSEVLGEVLENGAPGGAERTRGVPFAAETRQRPVPFAADDLPEEEIVAPYPVTVSTFVKAVNAAKAPNMRSLRISALTNWLSDQGYLETETVDGKARRRVTPQGEELGVSETARQGYDGAYYSIRYSTEAQRFLLERLPAIVADGYNDAQPREDDLI